MGYIIGAVVVSLLFFVVGLVLISHWFRFKINDDVLSLHDNFILSAVTEHKKQAGKLKAPGAFKKNRTLINYCLFTVISLVSTVYFAIILFTSYMNF